LEKTPEMPEENASCPEKSGNTRKTVTSRKPATIWWSQREGITMGRTAKLEEEGI